MVEHAHRYLARAEELPHELQQHLARHGDRWTRHLLFSREDIDPALVHAAITSAATADLETWIRHPGRPRDLIDAAYPLLTSENAQISLAHQENLSPRILNDLLIDPNPMLAWTLVSRTDLPAGARGTLVGTYLASLQHDTESLGSPFRGVRGVLDAHPEAWPDALRVSPRIAQALLPFIPTSNDPALHQAVMDQVVRITSEPGFVEGTGTSRFLNATIRRLIASPHLDVEHLNTLERLIHRHDLDLLPLIRERQALDGPALVASFLNCNGAGTHVSAISDLIDASTLLEVDRAALGIEALRHHEHLTPRQLERAIGLSRGTLAPQVINTLERSEGPGSKAVLVGVTLFGAHTLKYLDDPLPVVTQLARNGWEPLGGTEHDPHVQQVIVDQFAPMHGMLQQEAYRRTAITAVAQLEPGAQETAMALLPEWNGTLPDLLQAAHYLGNAAGASGAQ